MKLEGKLCTYPVDISPRDLVLKIIIIREFREEIKGMGFSQELKKSNSKELAIPEGLGQG